jgi:hypothetical protein
MDTDEHRWEAKGIPDRKSARFSIVALLLLLAGCHRQGDAETQRNLPGTWIMTRDDAENGPFQSTITFGPSGDYVCQVVAKNRWDGLTRTSNLAGRFEVRDGMLIDTMTKNSNTNAELPIISTARIVRSNGRELVLKFEGNEPGYPTNEIVWRKEER